MTRHFTALRYLLLLCCLVLIAACATDPEAGEGATEVVTEEITERVTEQETVVVTPPADGDAGEDDTGDGDEDDTGDGDESAREQPFPANTARDDAQASGGQLTLTDVRVGTHEGYDRVTFEFTGDGEPGWVVEYTDDPRQQGSGAAVDVAGDAVLNALMSSVAYPTGEAYDGPERIDPPRLQVIDEVVMGATFEGHLGAFIGVTDEVPFRARRFSDPPRVVIDVVHPDATG